MISKTLTFELRELHANTFPPRKSASARFGRLFSKSRAGKQTTFEVLEDEAAARDVLPSPATAPAAKDETWNASRTNIFRICATFWSFIAAGMNDASIGALIPSLQDYYNLEYATVALLFLPPFIGYTISAFVNSRVHMAFGQRGIAVISPTCHVLAALVAALHPPFWVVVTIYGIAGLGNGFQDAAWNAWIGNMANANEVLGFLHGFYGLGATIGPLVATSITAKAHWPWYYFYYLMLGIAGLELVICSAAFWTATGAKYRAMHSKSEGDGNIMKEAVWSMPAARVTWLCALFLMGYVGMEVALGGWITSFMLKVRHSSAFASGMSATGFWLGLTVGRVVLGFVTPRLGESLAVLIYIPICMGLELLFWLVPQFYVSTVAVAFQGFFLGPLFPTVILAATKLLPRHLHVTSIGFAAAFGGGGAALFPFAVGAIAQAKGVEVLQPIILALLGFIFVLWACLPRIRKKR